MKKSALNFEGEDISIAESREAIDDSPVFTPTPYPRLVSVPFATAKELQTKDRRRRKRFFLFIKLELSALVLLALLLVAGTSTQFAQAGLTRPFEIGILAAAAAVAIIPVVFYGPTRQKYRYRSANRTRSE
jgi:hypothetical protein